MSITRRYVWLKKSATGLLRSVWGINLYTVCTWISKAKRKKEQKTAIVAAYGETKGLAVEVEQLRKQLREREEEIENLQDALSFFAKRRKK